MVDYTQRVEHKLEDLTKHEFITEKNLSNVQEFTENIRVDDNISDQRVYKYLCTWKILFQEYVEFDIKKAGKEDWKRAKIEMDKSDKSAWTISDYLTTAKKYYRTVYEEETERPKRVKKILNASFMTNSGSKPRSREYKALSPKEVMEMSETAENPRDKLLPVFLFETGARIGEVLGLDECEGIRLKDVDFKKKYADVSIETSKVKDDRGEYPVRNLTLTRSVDLLQKWIEQHPQKDDSEAHLFCNLSHSRNNTQPGDPMTYSNVNNILDKLKERSEVDKRVSPHIFRHSSATHKGHEWGDVEGLMWWHGWQKLETAQNYVHANEKRQREKHLEREGIQNEDKDEDDSYSMKTCGRCGEEWPPTMNFCGSCSLALDSDSAVEAKEAQEAKDKAVEKGLKVGEKELLERVKNLEEKL